MLEVKIHSDLSNGLQILFYTERNGKQFIVKHIEMELEEIKHGEAIRPTFEIPYLDAESFLKSLAEALDERGVKTDSDAKIEGTLGATKYHLEDLRHLLKLKKGA